MDRRDMACMTAVLIAGMVSAGSPEAAGAEGSWETGIALGFNLARGNSESVLGNLKVTSERAAGVYSISLGAETAYGETTVENDDGTTSTDTTAQNAKGTASVERKFNGSFAKLDAAVAHDAMAEVDYRITVGLGLGYYVLDREELKVSLSVGPGYLIQQIDGSGADYPTLQLAQEARWIVNETATLRQTAGLQSKADDFGNYILSAEVMLETVLTQTMNLRFTIKDAYDSEPADGVEHNDLTVITALSVKL